MAMKPVFEKVPGGYVAWVDGLPGALTQATRWTKRGGTLVTP